MILMGDLYAIGQSVKIERCFFVNPKQALYIRTIADCGSLTGAAKKLYVSQPSLSQMLRRLYADAQYLYG